MSDYCIMAKTDLLDKGAILQRDKETYAIAPRIPGGICNPATLRKLADVAEKYHAAALKVTGAQRIAIVDAYSWAARRLTQRHNDTMTQSFFITQGSFY